MDTKRNDLISKLCDIVFKIHAKMKDMEQIGIEFQFINDQRDEVESLIIDIVNIPKDTVDELGSEHPDVFSRDFVLDWFEDFYDKQITKDELIYNLVNWDNK